MRAPLKTLFILEDLCYGGTQKQNLALALRLNRDFFDPVLLTLTGPTDLDEIATAQGITVLHIGKGRNVDPFFFVKLGQAISRISPDILVPCTALPNIWGRIWGKIKRVPLIIGTCRGGGAPWRQHERFLWRLADGIVCNSQALVEDMASRGVDRAKLIYISNGVDTGHFHPLDNRQRQQLILCVARLAEDKDHITLLKAFAQLARDIPEVRLRLVGEGPEEQKLKDFCATHLDKSIANRVEFYGASADPAPQYAAASVFALSSIREGQPNAIIEAMSSGLPVCATDAGGIPDLLEDSGLLSPIRDVGKLAANLARVLQDQELATKLGSAGREKAERDFSFATMVEKHEKLFLNLWQQRIEK